MPDDFEFRWSYLVPTICYAPARGIPMTAPTAEEDSMAFSLSTMEALFKAIEKKIPLPDGWRYRDGADDAVVVRSFETDGFILPVWRWPGMDEYYAAIESGAYERDSPQAEAERRKYESHFYDIDRKRVAAHEGDLVALVAAIHKEVGRDLLGEQSTLKRGEWAK